MPGGSRSYFGLWVGGSGGDAAVPTTNGGHLSYQFWWLGPTGGLGSPIQAFVTTRLSIIGTSQERLNVIGPSAERINLLGSST